MHDMIVESEDLFADDNPRTVSLVQRTTNTAGNVIWDIVLDGVNTGAGFTQGALDIVKADKNQDTFDRMVELTKDRLEQLYQCKLTDEEETEFRKLLKSLI